MSLTNFQLLAEIRSIKNFSFLWKFPSVVMATGLHDSIISSILIPNPGISEKLTAFYGCSSSYEKNNLISRSRSGPDSTIRIRIGLKRNNKDFKMNDYTKKVIYKKIIFRYYLRA